MLKTTAPQLRVEVDSAGTADYHIGEPPDARTQKAAQERGVDLSGLRARQLTKEDFARFDLILAMDQANLRDLKAEAPAGSRAKLKLFLDYAPQLGRTEVPDPYYGERGGFEEVFDLCATASKGLITELQKVPQ